MAIIHAIVNSAGGFTRVREPTASASGVEVFLPRFESARTATSATSDYSHTVLLVGPLTSLFERFNECFGKRVLFLQAADPDEARRVAQLYESDIDLVIWDESSSFWEAQAVAKEKLLQRRPDLVFLSICSSQASTEVEVLEIEQEVKDLLRRKVEGAIGHHA